MTESDYLALLGTRFLYSAINVTRSQNQIMTRETVMKSGGYYVATRVLIVWKRLAGLAPDQPHVWSFFLISGRRLGVF